MHGSHNYVVQVEDRLEEGRVVSGGPVEARAVSSEARGTHLEVIADQSALIGLLRYLHQEGFVLLSLARRPEHEGGDEDEAQ